MKIMVFAALFFIATHVRVCAQDTTAYEWSLQGAQVDFAAFPLITLGALSWSAAVDIDFGVRKHTDGTATYYGCQIGFSQFDWPYFGYYEIQHYSGSDVDVLLRYTSRSFPFRTDIVAGLSIRDGAYENTRAAKEFWGQRELSVTAGLKIGGAMTLMVIRPAIAVRFKASCRVFGFKRLEGGALGLGLVVGWQRDD